MRNIGLLYYKDYYKIQQEDLKRLFYQDSERLTDNEKKRLKENHFDEKNRILLDLTIGSGYQQATNSNSGLKMQVVGPGLLMGTGNTHQTGKQGEFKLGFFFDHATGLPILPASSIKGVLRSFFEGKKVGFTLNIIKEVLGIEIDDLGKLKENIFEGKDADGTQLAVYKRDLFFDAFPYSNTSQKLFANDFITPHKHPTERALDPFSNPTPIEFMKIKKGVCFNFKFKLSDFTYKNLEFSAEKKKILFRELLQIGIGAKTNVGYGQLKPIE